MTIELSIVIQEGPRSLIDTIQYIGFDDVPSDLQEEIKSRPLIRVGDPFVNDRVGKRTSPSCQCFF